ncbi:hypothetical protein FRB99_000369 [Tulasnella sp. 403]|nr:hypothetical protein FRB99_000369 [Tulasnella sp. 403]
MAYNQDPLPGPSSARSSDLESPHSPDPTAAAIRLRLLVPNPHDPLAVSNRLVDVIKDIQASKRPNERDAPYLVSVDQLGDLLLLAQQAIRNSSSSDIAGISSQLTELTSKISDVQHAVRGTRPWTRLDPLPANGYTHMVPLSDTPPPTSYSRERQPVGLIGADGRIYGLMEDQRRMWAYPTPPTWSRDYEHSRSSATAPGELSTWYPIGRRPSRAEETQPPLGDQHVSRPEPGSSVPSAYDARPQSVRPSPIHVNAAPAPPIRLGSEKPRLHHIPPPVSAPQNNPYTTPSSSTAVTDSSSKAPSISFLVNPSYESGPSRVSRDSRSPPPSQLPPVPSRYDPHSMDVDSHRPLTSLDSSSSFTTPNGSKVAKSAKSDVTAHGKRRIRNGACTFCREKKLACRPGPMADDPNATGPPTCDQCYRRQRTCQHDPEHRRRRRTTVPGKKGGPSDDPKPAGSQAPFDVDQEDITTNRMESEDPSIPIHSPEPRAPRQPVKDEEVDQLETDWMQPD